MGVFEIDGVEADAVGNAVVEVEIEADLVGVFEITDDAAGAGGVLKGARVAGGGDGDDDVGDVEGGLDVGGEGVGVAGDEAALAAVDLVPGAGAGIVGLDELVEDVADGFVGVGAATGGDGRGDVECCGKAGEDVDAFEQRGFQIGGGGGGLGGVFEGEDTGDDGCGEGGAVDVAVAFGSRLDDRGAEGRGFVDGGGEGGGKDVDAGGGKLHADAGGGEAGPLVVLIGGGDGDDVFEGEGEFAGKIGDAGGVFVELFAEVFGISGGGDEEDSGLAGEGDGAFGEAVEGEAGAAKAGVHDDDVGAARSAGLDVEALHLGGVGVGGEGGAAGDDADFPIDGATDFEGEDVSGVVGDAGDAELVVDLSGDDAGDFGAVADFVIGDVVVAEEVPAADVAGEAVVVVVCAGDAVLFGLVDEDVVDEIGRAAGVGGDGDGVAVGVKRGDSLVDAGVEDGDDGALDRVDEVPGVGGLDVGAGETGCGGVEAGVDAGECGGNGLAGVLEVILAGEVGIVGDGVEGVDEIGFDDVDLGGVARPSS